MGSSELESHGPAPARGLGIPLGGILLTLVTVAAIAGIAIPGFFGRHEVTLDNAAVLLARELRAAQDRAAYLGQTTVVLLDADGLQVVDAAGRPVSRVGTSLPFERRFSADAVFEGVRLEHIDFAGKRVLTFDGGGLADRSGEILVTFQGEHRSIELLAPSGTLRIHGLSRRWHDRDP